MNEDEIERKVVYMKHPSFYDSFSPDDYAHRSLTERKQKKKILKKRDELEGIYIQLSTQGVYTLCDIICIDHHFPLRFADEIRPVRHFCYVWHRVFPLSR